MKRIIDWLRKIRYNGLFYIFAVVQIILFILYIYMSDGLEKPAGFFEAIRFLINAPLEYISCILIGIVCWIISTILISSVILEIPIIKELVYDEYSYYENIDEEVNKKIYILNIVIAIVLFIANFICLKFLLILSVTLIVITLVAVTMLSND